MRTTSNQTRCSWHVVCKAAVQRGFSVSVGVVNTCLSWLLVYNHNMDYSDSLRNKREKLTFVEKVISSSNIVRRV